MRVAERVTVTDSSGFTDTEIDFILVTGGTCITESCENSV